MKTFLKISLICLMVGLGLQVFVVMASTSLLLLAAGFDSGTITNYSLTVMIVVVGVSVPMYGIYRLFKDIYKWCDREHITGHEP